MFWVLAGGAPFDDVRAKAGEKLLRLGFETDFSVVQKGFVDFDADAVAAAVCGGQKRGAGAHEGVQDGVAHKGKHPH